MILLQGDAKSGLKAPRAKTLPARYRPLIGLMVLLSGQLAANEGIDFFEKNIRPVLATRCYACHSARVPVAQGGLYADTKDGLLRGGNVGKQLVKLD